MIESKNKKQRATWLGSLAGISMLAIAWIVAAVAEPYLIKLSMPYSTAVEPRSSAAGWANSNVWLAAELVALFALLFSGFIARWLSPARSWWAPGIVAALCVAYIVFAQFPATHSSARVALWSLGSLVAVAAGVWLGSLAGKEQDVA